MFISMATHGRNIRFPTAAMAKIDFAVTSWKDVCFGEGKLAWLQRPKALE
jgi:phosphohistidine phosphatase SixA